jgi:uncharacterized protein YbbC (DUF1343 family)
MADRELQLLFGVDRLVRGAVEEHSSHTSAVREILRGSRRLGLLTNDAARLAHDPGVRTREALLGAGLPITRLFSPEHGLGARAPDGAMVADAVDAVTGLPISSLYGERFAPPQAALRACDAVLVDLPDVGARFYTYVWTMTHLIDACAELAVPVVVLDRPNPLGGLLAMAEGPLLEPACASFLGRLPVPIRHAVTIGEMAVLWQRERAVRSVVEVLPMRAWTRQMQWPDTGLTFVPTSPAMPSFESALLYPGLCLFEATNLSVDRAGRAPFRSLAAPWLDAAAIADATHPYLEHFGVRAVPSGHTLGVEIVDRRAVRPVAVGCALLEAIARRHAEFAWTTYPTAANPSGEGHIDRLAGTPRVCAAIDTRRPIPHDLLDVPGWDVRVADVQLYPDT